MVRNKKLIVVLIVILVSVAGLLAWWRHSAKPAPATARPSNSAATKNAADGKPANNSAGQTNQSPKSSVVAPTGTLVEPSGNFVSNHQVGLSSKSLANHEQSVCNVAPGTACQIQFSKDGVTRTLAAKTAGTDGAVSWDWWPEDLSLTPGSWKITAVASLNGQTKSANDALSLEVAP